MLVMEEIIKFDQTSPIDANTINKLYDQEKHDRIANNKKKCLETSKLILTKFLEANDNIGFLSTMKNLYKKKDQSGFVIYYIIQFSANNFFNKIKDDEILKCKYVDSVKSMLEYVKKVNGKGINFDELKMKITNSLEEKDFEEYITLINRHNFDSDDLINEKKSLKKISLGDSSVLSHSDSSTKIEKLEISMNKDYSSSTRNFNLISPNQKVVSNTDTFGINQEIKNDHINYTIINKAKLPHLRIGVIITLSSLEIKRIFIDEMRNHKATLKGDENSEIIQADKKNFNLIKSLLDCFSVTRRSITVNSIQFTIKYSENFHERIIDIKALNGKREICEEMILSFIASLAKKLVKVRKIKVEAINIDKILKENREEEKRRLANIYGLQTLLNYESLKDEDNSIVDFSNKEATNFYELYKILSQENYELGKSVSDFIENFKSENSDIDNASSNIPQQMESILKFINSCVSAFFCYFNYGKSNTERMLPYVRPAVENILFKKLSDIIYALYNCKYKAENEKFKKSQENIKKYMTTNDIMEYLEINKKFRTSEKFGIPFKSTIDYINKIELEHTPKDKFETLMRANLELRNEVLDITRGKYELNSMDDELPLFIYIISQINLKNALVELNLIENYLQYSPSLDKESKVLTNFRSSIFYISHEWKIDKSDENINKIIENSKN